MPTPRILILAAHPDDETVGCAAAIGRAQAAGSRLFVLALTTGVPEPTKLWPWQRGSWTERCERRRREARQAWVALGLAPAGELPWPSRTLRLHLDAAAAAIGEAAAACAAQMLWVPAYEGGHQDHDAANVLGASMQRLAVWEYAEYNLAGGRVRSQQFPVDGPDVVTLTLDAAERRRKRKILGIYASEQANLRHVGCRQESFRPLSAHDYARPPHHGCLFYERFRWVPFPHPRIDRTTFEEVSRDLSSFGGTAS